MLLCCCSQSSITMHLCMRENLSCIFHVKDRNEFFSGTTETNMKGSQLLILIRTSSDAWYKGIYYGILRYWNCSSQKMVIAYLNLNLNSNSKNEAFSLNISRENEGQSWYLRAQMQIKLKSCLLYLVLSLFMNKSTK